MDRAARLIVLLALAATAGAEDPYLTYLKRAPEWEPVPAIASKRWDTWIYMPWRYRWTIGLDDAAARFCREHGINGGFADHGEGPLAWFERHGFRFYADHTAGKGILYLRGANERANFKTFQANPRAIRTVPLDDATLVKAKGLVRRHLADVRRSPMRIAYALDDEVSTGAFVIPLPWRVDADDERYARWLKDYYGRAVKPRYVTPEFTRAQLDRPLGELDFSPLLDRMSYNDSRLALFVGALVRFANGIDGETPCGVVGAQNPSLWGGYDYAKLMKHVQFLEPYDMGSAPEIARSLGKGRTTIVSTHFHDGELKSDNWKAWSRFAHGQRGMIGWIDKWFDGKKPRPWLATFAPVLKELGGVQGPKLAGARFAHDGIAIYYSHPSVQVSWVLDSAAHGKTWPNRGNDAILGTSHNVRRAWEAMLADNGLQHEYVAYDDVARDGVPEEYRVLILPACFALSDVEAERIRAFAAQGGLVIADFMCGLFDQHGKGRAKGALDDLFGVAHDGTLTKADFFEGERWVETDQDKGYNAERWRDLFGDRETFAVPERRVKGNAAYLNLSPQLYLMLREEGRETPEHRARFVPPALTPRVAITGARHLEPIFWEKDGRTLLLIVQNPVERGDGSKKVLRGEVKITLRFKRTARDVIDERTGERLGDGAVFRRPMKRTEAIFLSYR